MVPPISLPPFSLPPILQEGERRRHRGGDGRWTEQRRVAGGAEGRLAVGGATTGGAKGPRVDVERRQREGGRGATARRPASLARANGIPVSSCWLAWLAPPFVARRCWWKQRRPDEIARPSFLAGWQARTEREKCGGRRGGRRRISVITC